MITSFCKSWMTMAAALGLILSISPPPLVHVAESVARDLHPHAVHGRRGRDVQGAPVVVAPVDVAHAFGHLDRAEVLAVRTEDPDAVRAGDVDVSLLVDLHSVDEAAFRE